MIGYWVGLMGMWIFSDGMLSWVLYLNAPSYQGSPRQTFFRDHWIRCVRIGMGIGLMVMGTQVLGQP